MMPARWKSAVRRPAHCYGRSRRLQLTAVLSRYFRVWNIIAAKLWSPASPLTIQPISLVVPTNKETSVRFVYRLDQLRSVPR